MIDSKFLVYLVLGDRYENMKGFDRLVGKLLVLLHSSKDEISPLGRRGTSNFMENV